MAVRWGRDESMRASVPPESERLMANKHLATYLNDHLAGSVTALELLTALQAAQANPDVARFLAELQSEVAADQRALEALMERLQIAKRRPRQAAAWLAEKLTQL